MLWPQLGTCADKETLYQTSFEAPAFAPGLPIRGQDNWSMFHEGEALSIATNNAFTGAQCLRIEGSLLEQVGPNFARGFAFSRALENSTQPAAIVEISAQVRLDGPRTGTNGTPEQDLVSANFFATVSFTASAAATLGGFFVSSAGRIWTYGGLPQDAYKYSTPYTLGTYRSLTLRVDFIARKLTYLVDGIELGSSSFAPNVSADQLYSGYLELAGALDPIDTPDLTYDLTRYAAYFDDYSLVSVPPSPVNTLIEFTSEEVLSDEFQTSVRLGIVRRGFTNAAVRVTVITEEDTAKAGEDYDSLSTFVRFAPGETNKTVEIPLGPDDVWPEPDKSFKLRLSGLPPGASSPKSRATVIIRDDDRPGSIDSSWSSELGLPPLTPGAEHYAVPEIIAQLPDGRMILHVAVEDSDFSQAAYFRILRINPDGSVDPSFRMIESRVASQVVTLTLEGKLLVSSRSKGNGAPMRLDYRLNPDGSQDTSFHATLSGSIGLTLIPQAGGKILVNGEHPQSVMLLNGRRMPALFRLNNDGTLDDSFSAPANLVGSLRPLPNGQLYLSANYAPPYRLYRLNPDGGLDSNFAAPENLDLNIKLLLSNGEIVATSLYAQQYESTKLYRLQPDGSLSADYSVGTALGQPHIVFSVVEQFDVKLVVSGVFRSFNEEVHNSIVRLNVDGTVDPTFRSGTGFTEGNSETPGQIYLSARADQSLLVSGSFDEYDGEKVTPPILLNPDGTWNHEARNDGTWIDAFGFVERLPAVFLNGEFLGSPSYGTDMGALYFTGKGLGRIRTNLPLRIVSQAHETNGTSHLLANALPAQTYTLQVSENLRDWTDLITQRATTNRIEFTDSPTAPPARMLYRVRQN